MKKMVFSICFALMHFSCLLADSLNFKQDKTITYEYIVEGKAQVESFINFIKNDSSKVTFDIKLLKTNKQRFPFEVEVIIRHLESTKLIDRDGAQNIISYDSRTHKASGFNKKIVSLYNSIINKHLHFKIDHNKTKETTGILTKLNDKISKLLKNKQIDLIDSLSDFGDVISVFFHLSDVDINVGSRYDWPVNYIEGKNHEKGEVYYVITNLDSNKIQADVGGFFIVSSELQNDVRGDISGNIEINKNNALIRNQETCFKAYSTGNYQRVPYSLNVQVHQRLSPVRR